MPTKNNLKLSKAEKILLVMYQLGEGRRTQLKFEDIVVGSFKRFPEDFHLRGYEEYPDSGDLVHKPLYDFRKKGHVEAGNKVFSLTEKGLNHARRLQAVLQGKQIVSNDRMSRYVETELARIENTEGYKIFVQGDLEKIRDADLYNYLGVAPRTAKNDFLGRLQTLEDTIAEVKRAKSIEQRRKQIPNYHAFLMQKFPDIIDHFKKQ